MTKPIIEGSSKEFFAAENGLLLMRFKDDIHGASRASEIEGTGALRKAFSYHFYRRLEERGLRTHLAAMPQALREDGILVRQAAPVKLEILVRNVARGHWVDAHKVPLFDGGTVFDEPVVEFCLKLKFERADGSIVDDPRINPALAVALDRHAKLPTLRGHMLKSAAEAETLTQLALDVNRYYRQFLDEQGWILEDFKFEVGRLDDGFALIDEISPDCSRIRDADGKSLSKDLFRQRRPESEIYAGYKALADAIAEEPAYA